MCPCTPCTSLHMSVCERARFMAVSAEHKSACGCGLLWRQISDPPQIFGGQSSRRSQSASCRPSCGCTEASHLSPSPAVCKIVSCRPIPFAAAAAAAIIASPPPPPPPPPPSSSRPVVHHLQEPMCQCISQTCVCAHYLRTVSVSSHAPACVGTYTCACMHVWLHACVHPCICACMSACMCTCMRACMHTAHSHQPLCECGPNSRI